MMNKKELKQLSKNDLIRIILAQEERLVKLERYLKAFDNAHTPPSKKRKKKEKNEDDSNSPRFPGKPKGSNGGGVQLPPPDEIKEHTLDVCPLTGCPLGEPIGYRKKTIIDFPDKPIQVIEHRIMQYYSYATNQIVEADIRLPSGIYGNNLKSIVVMLKDLTNSHAKIARFLQQLGPQSFSTATVQGIADDCAERLAPLREKLLKSIRRHSYLHADETEFRQDGTKGYVWGIFTKTKAVYLAADGRARIHIQSLLKNFKGIIVTDGYRAYDIYDLRQRCWVHLLREGKELAQEDEEITIQYTALLDLYKTLKELNSKPPDKKEIQKVKKTLKGIVTCLEKITAGKKLATLIKNGGDHWFTALYHKGVPLENNHAERGIRPLVLLRKTIGCYRNEKGKKWIDIVLSVLHTWRLQGRSLFQQLRPIWA